MLILPQFVLAETYWECQCFESVQSSTSSGGTKIYGQNSLKDAEKAALKSCKTGKMKKKLIARSIHFVITDH